MKKLFSLFAILLFAASMNAQIPQKMTYQAVIRDASDKLISNKTIGIKISILKGTTVVYSEVYNPNPTTNQNGLLTLEIGGGTALLGTFSAIDWADGPYFIKTEIDPNGGTTYSILGSTQLLSVPYAFYAKTSGPVTENDPIFRASPAKGITNADITKWNNKDDSNTNELQRLRINGNQLSITDGNTVTLPAGSGGGDQWGTQVVASDATLKGDGTEAHPLGVDVNVSAFGNWDKDVSDDFSGNYNDLSNKPVTFFEIGGTKPPNAITDNMYHAGSISIGTNILVAGNKLFIKSVNNNAILNDIDYTGSSYGKVVENKLTVNSNTTAVKAYCASVKNSIDGNGNILSYGVYNTITNTGSKAHIGTGNSLTGSGSGAQIGCSNYISNTGNGEHYGIVNHLSGSGSGIQVGCNNYITNTSNEEHYGAVNYLTGRGTGKKYGVWGQISTSAGGDHYAIYGEVTSREVTKSGNYAGYFKGDVYVSKKLLGNHSGSADMKAYIYGYILSAGTKLLDASSDGFTCTRTAIGVYRVAFNNPPSSSSKYIVLATATNSQPITCTIVKGRSYFKIYVWNKIGKAATSSIQFVVYKK